MVIMIIFVWFWFLLFFLFCFGGLFWFYFGFILYWVFYFWVGLAMSLAAATKRQTHRRSFGTGKSAGVVGGNLGRTAGVCQISIVVHDVTIGHIIFGKRPDNSRLNQNRLSSRGSRGRLKRQRGGGGEGQRHFYEILQYFIFMKTTFLKILLKFYFFLYASFLHVFVVF